MTGADLFFFGLMMLGTGALAWVVRAFGREDNHPYTIWHRKMVEPCLLLGLVSTIIGGVWLLIA